MNETPAGNRRVELHPILPPDTRAPVEFFWRGRALVAREGERIASALIAGGIDVFGHHPKDGSPQGIFCANGQCSQCTVIADGVPVKACMEAVRPGLRVEPLDGNPALPPVTRPPRFHAVAEVATDCLVLGGGPAGLAAASELGKAGVGVLLVDDKHRLGGKLVLQTHKFFGSIADCHAGMRGIDIATVLEEEVRALANVECWLEATAVGVFSDGGVGIVRGGREYVLVRPETLLVATGAREKMITFPGNTLPGVYGAGAFQTLVNRDQVRPAVKLFIVGGGNVGLIAGYHALQAGIPVVGLVEALAECGGYKVHADKLRRFGVPLHTRHTVVSANGTDRVESITIAAVDERWQARPGTERTYPCDTVLIAVGLDPVDEFYHKAVAFGLKAFAAGDAAEIAEASAAMFSGRIQGLEIARALGRDVPEVPTEWREKEAVLKSKPGAVAAEVLPAERDVQPVFHCCQEIPCDPCTSVCPEKAIVVGEDLRGRPRFLGEEFGKKCIGCGACVAICPGLAVTLVDWRRDPEFPIVTIAHEFPREWIRKGDRVTVLDTEGQALGEVEIVHVASAKKLDRALLVRARAPRAIARRIAGIRVQEPAVGEPMEHYVARLTDETVVCRCERVTAAELRALVRRGVRDVNELKAITRAGMGACGAKTCAALIRHLFLEEGVPADEITPNVERPLFVEVPFGVFSGTEIEDPSP
ncbi:MAG: FAD-dependent oxidoreductase [Planctomycetes bacterium]|nr:FAD-dependent oxidoreductase [Planctomycetota bacterium]